MLSLEACRELLGDEAPADERELAARRDHAYHLARLLIEIYREQKASKESAFQSAKSPPDMI